MQFDKSQIIDLLHQLGNHYQAAQASEQLPEKVDTAQHGGLLQGLGLSPQDLISKLGAGGVSGL
jgi:hypothetical protein